MGQKASWLKGKGSECRSACGDVDRGGGEGWREKAMTGRKIGDTISCEIGRGDPAKRGAGHSRERMRGGGGKRTGK